MEERERVILRLLEFSDSIEDPALADQVVHLVLYTVLDHSDSQVRRHGVLVILHAIETLLHEPSRQEAALRVTVHFAMSHYGGNDPRLAEFFEVLGHAIEMEDEEVQLAMTVVLVEIVAQHPDMELRRAVIGAIIVGIYEDGQNSLNGDVFQHLMSIIAGDMHDGDDHHYDSDEDDHHHDSDEDDHHDSDEEDDHHHGSDEEDDHHDDSHEGDEHYSHLMQLLMGGEKRKK